VYDKDRGIFISYWKDESAIDRWRNTALHVRAKSNGSKWYKWYLVEIAKIEYQKEYQQ
jgi:heme-degrading monooxygenase HmoA